MQNSVVLEGLVFLHLCVKGEVENSLLPSTAHQVPAVASTLIAQTAVIPTLVSGSAEIQTLLVREPVVVHSQTAVAARDLTLLSAA